MALALLAVVAIARWDSDSKLGSGISTNVDNGVGDAVLPFGHPDDRLKRLLEQNLPPGFPSSQDTYQPTIKPVMKAPDSIPAGDFPDQRFGNIWQGHPRLASP